MLDDQNNRSNDVIEIDLRELFIEFMLNWKSILAAALLGAALCFCIRYFLLLPKYEATSLLYVLTKSTSITSLADLQTGANLTQDYLIVTKGRPVLDQVIYNLKLPENYEELEEIVEVTNPANTRFIEITVKDTDPLRAKAISDEIAELAAAFIAEKMDQDPPSLIQYGYADGEPVNHGVVFYSCAGFAGGLLAALICVALSYIFNDTVMSPEDLESKIGIRVLASLPVEESEFD